MSIILALIIFGFLIFIHELGHFIVARLCGVKVLEFAIGMGPKIISWTSKKSGTKYAIRLLPFGGFVSMLGENGMETVQGENGMPSEPQKEGTSDEENDGSVENGSDDTFFVNSPSEKYVDGDYNPVADYDGMRVDAEDTKHAYCNQSVWKRILISIAGPAMNVILGFVLMFVMILLSGAGSIGNTVVANFHIVYTGESIESSWQNGDYLVAIDGMDLDSYAQLKQIVEENPNELFDVTVQRLDENGTSADYFSIKDVSFSEEFLENSLTFSLSERAGLQIGDVIKKVNSTRVHTAHELSYEISIQGYQPLTLTVERNGKTEVLENVIFPSYLDSGVTFGSMDFRVWPEKSLDIGTVLKHTWFRSCSTVKMVFDSLGGLFSGRYGMEAVSGPVGITQTISEAAKIGFINVLYLVIVISINLGIMNLLPIPGLDGGHLLIYFIEVIRRKPMKRELEGMVNFIGLIVMLALMVLIMIKDIINIF